MNFGVSSSTYTPNPEAMAAYRRSLSMAENVSSQPFKPYEGQMVAGFSPDQMRAFQATREMQNMAAPYYAAGTAALGQALDYSDPRNFNARTLQQYQNPYQQQVVDATMANLAQLNAQQEQQGRTAAAQRGTFGGSGEFQGRAEIARQQALANAQTLAGLQQSGYQQAVGQYNQQQQQAIQTAQNAAYGLGQIGSGAQNAAMQSIQALLGTGGAQQQMAQQQLTGAYQQWLQAQAYPYQQAAFYSGIASGIAPNMGGTTNTTSFGMGNQQQQQPSGGGGGAGMGMSVLSMLPSLFGMSDEDDKTDIKYLGKDESGEKLYAYRYKGDPKSYPKVVGPMAQDIEERDPDRVSEVGGHKIVEGLGRLAPSEREHFADGGAGTGAAGLGALGAQAGGTGAQAQQSIYDAPQAPSTGVPPAQAAGASSSMDPNVASFIQGVFDPQTADRMARAKWVNQPVEADQDGGDNYPYNPLPGFPRADGGRAEYAGGGGMGIGSFFDIIKQTGPAGPFAMAPDNVAGAAQEIGIGKIIPQAQDKAKGITGEAAASGLKSVMKDAPSGGGGGGGGGGGAPKMPSMKPHKSGETPAQPSQDAATQTPQDAGAAHTPVDSGAAHTPVDSGAAHTPVEPGVAAAAPMTEIAPAPVDVAPPPMDFAAAAPPLPEIPLLGMFGGMRDGGRVHKDGGGAAAGGGGMGTLAAPADAALGPDGGFGALGVPGTGIGDIVLGGAPSISDSLGFGNIAKTQNPLTGEAFLKQMDVNRFKNSAGPQLSPVEQGMPEMPKPEFYQQPRTDLPGKLMTETYGEQNYNPVFDFMAMAGMGGKGGAGKMGAMGLAGSMQQQQAAAEARGKQAELKAQRESMLKDPANFPVQGYFSKIGDNRLNEATGLYNMDYTGAYRGYPFKDGGRVPLAKGGGPTSEMIETFSEIEKRHNLPAGYLVKMAEIESRFGHAPDRPKSQYKGMFQMGRQERAATGVKDPSDWRQSAEGAAKLSESNAKILEKALGRAPTGRELYLAHQQGASGASALLRHPELPADQALRLARVPDATHHVTANPYPGMGRGMPTAGQFSQGWESRFDRAAPGVTQYASAPSSAGVVAQDQPTRRLPMMAPEGTKWSEKSELIDTKSGSPIKDIAKWKPEAAPAAARPLPAGSVLNRINPADPSGPLLGTPAPGVQPPAMPTPQRVAEAAPPTPAPRRGFSLSDLNPISSAQASEAAPQHQHEGFGSVAERMRGLSGTYGPGITEQQSTLTDFGNMNPDRAMLADTPYAQTMVGAPLTPYSEQPEPAAPPPVAEATPEAAAPAEASGQKYWGDWRDVEPFKSDPIGGFIDTLTGETPHAAHPGTLESAAPFDLGAVASDTGGGGGGFDLGSILPEFARGGVARKGYAAAGSVPDDMDPLSLLGEGLGSLGEGVSHAIGSVGEGLGSLFQGSPSASEPVASASAPQGGGGRGLTWSPFQSGLLAAGLATMASQNPNTLGAIGEGGLRGLQVYEAAAETEREREQLENQKRVERQQELDFQRQMAGRPKAEEISEEEISTPKGSAEEVTVRTPRAAETETVSTRAPAPASARAGVLEPETIDIEADPTIRRLSEEYSRIASIPAPKNLLPVKNAQISNLKFQIEERRRQLESSVKARKAQLAAEQNTPEAKARAKQIETEQEALSKESIAMEQAARQADQRISTLNRMKDAVQSGKFSTGLGAETKLAAQKAIQSVSPSLVDEDAIALAEQFEKDALQAVTDATGGKLGAGVSDSDVRFLTRQQAGLGTSKAGNIRTLDAAIKVEQRKKDIAEFQRKYRDEHGGILDQGFYRALSEWAEKNPMFPTKETKGGEKSSGRTVTRRGKTKDGKSVVQYSDGTIEYAQ
jgi:hypothetical protein